MAWAWTVAPPDGVGHSAHHAGRVEVQERSEVPDGQAGRMSIGHVLCSDGLQGAGVNKAETVRIDLHAVAPGTGLDGGRPTVPKLTQLGPDVVAGGSPQKDALVLGADQTVPLPGSGAGPASSHRPPGRICRWVWAGRALSGYGQRSVC